MNLPASLKLQVDQHIATLTISRPARRNALDTVCWHALTDACAQIALNNDVRVVLLRGEGEHFSAGADIHELREHISDAKWMSANQQAIARAIDAYAALPQPTVAVIRGSCFGGGAALATASDFRICTADARFAITPSKLGLTYRLVDCLRVVDLIGSARAREMLILAKELDASTASTWGFVTDVHAPDAIEGAVATVIARLLSLSSYSARGIKQSLRKIRAGQTDDDAETRAIFSAAFDGPDFAEGAAAFIEKRPPTFL
jgi:enoyl-CoA hydratase/carnithine racemase